MRQKKFDQENIWIIGASSGIGAALAAELSSRGARLALSARREEELNSLKTKIGEQHGVFPLDVTDNDQVTKTADAVQTAFGHIDRIAVLAAAYTPMRFDAFDMKLAQSIVQINLIGSLNVALAAHNLFKTQRKPGQIALCGSVAGYMGLPNGQPYSATKAAIINLAESLHAEALGQYDVKLISPGFVRTPLTAKNTFSMPAIIDPEEAAHYIADGLHSKGFEIHFPKKLTLALKFLRMLPYGLSLPITRKVKS